MKLILAKNKRDDETIDICKDRGKGRVTVWGSVHIDTFHDGGRKEIYNMLLEQDEVVVELQIVYPNNGPKCAMCGCNIDSESVLCSECKP